jgi:iron complex outermembrane receptor protein
VVLDHHLNADTMLFASWSKGYQAGGFDAVGVNGHYDEELVTNLELGIKGQLKAIGLSTALPCSATNTPTCKA